LSGTVSFEAGALDSLAGVVYLAAGAVSLGVTTGTTVSLLEVGAEDSLEVEAEDSFEAGVADSFAGVVGATGYLLGEVVGAVDSLAGYADGVLDSLVALDVSLEAEPDDYLAAGTVVSLVEFDEDDSFDADYPSFEEAPAASLAAAD